MNDPLKNITREDLWDWAGALRYELGYAGAHTGVVIPQNLTAGQVLDSSHARRIAAALILAADIHDRIYDRGWDDRGGSHERVRDTTKSYIDQVHELRELLDEVHAFLEELVTMAVENGVQMPRLNHFKERIDKVLAHES